MYTDALVWGVLAVGVILVGATLWLRPKPTNLRSHKNKKRAA